MIAINDEPLFQRFLAASILLSVLQNSLLTARRAVNAVVYEEQHGEMKPFYERISLAENLSVAAKKAMKAAGANLLDNDHVETFYRLAHRSCQEAVSALDFAIEKRGVGRNWSVLRDHLKGAASTLSI